MNNKYKYITALAFLVLSTSCAYSMMETKLGNPVKLNVQTEDVNIDLAQKDNFIKTKYMSAESKFISGNIKSSTDTFDEIIDKTEHDDYVLLSYAIKMAEFGFFEQTENIFNKLDNNLFTENYVNDIKKFYYPSSMLDKKDLIDLADAHSSIIYNNQAIEMTSELINNSCTTECDYKNYIIALGFYKSNNLSQALQYINNAIKENSININYKILKAKILADMDKGKQATKLIKEIRCTKFATIDFQTKLRANQEYLQYKILNNSVSKDYHLAYYYYLQGKNQLATKVLQTLILQAKEDLPNVYALLGKIHYDLGEYSAAEEFAQKANNIDGKNYEALMVLGNLNFDERKYENALKFYKRAYNQTKNAEAGVGVARCYFVTGDKEKSTKLYTKLLHKYPKNEDVLIAALNAYPQRADDYMSKIASIDISNADIWLALADIAIKDKNYSMANSYLNNSYYIDGNNFRYYYYLSLILKAQGNTEKSEQAFAKSIVINPDLSKELQEEGSTNEK